MTPDDDRTIVRPSSDRGRDATALGHVLPVGTRLREYEITGLIGEGGFGIVYLADDVSLQRRVAIKEYMPSSMASRVGSSATIVVKSDRHRETFEAGLKSFVNEARLLARFDHPALVKVYRFWEENGTAYMAMPYYEGPTLKNALAARREPPDEAALRQLLKPLLDALSVMHAAQCYHRDIAPDNILLTSTGPLLLDFGAARRVIGDMTHALTVVLKPGYAPIEQYGDVATMTQGAWTDLYALACVLYFAITGKVPMSSVERLMDDRLEPLSRAAAGRYSLRFLQAIDAALAVRPQDRPQTDAAFRALLDEPAMPPPAASAASAEADAPTRIVPRTVPPIGTPLGPVTGAPPPPRVQPVRPTANEEPTVIGPLHRTTPPGAPATAPGWGASRIEPRPGPPVLDTPHTTRPPPAMAMPHVTARDQGSRRDPVDSRMPPLEAPAPSISVARRATPAAPERFTAPTPQPAARPAAAPVPASEPATPRRATSSSRVPLYIAGGMAAVAIAIVGAVQLWSARTAASPDTVPNTTNPPPPARTATPPVTAPAVPSVDVRVPSTTTAAPTSITPPSPSTSGADTETVPPMAAPPIVTPVDAGPTTTPSSEGTAKHTATARPEPARDNGRAGARNEGPRYNARSDGAGGEASHNEPPVVKPARTPGVQAKCSDILQKASLEQLTAEENAFLRRECR